MFKLVELEGALGVATDTAPKTLYFTVRANEVSSLICVAEISAVSGGVGALNAATGIIYQSWDDGTTWETVPNQVPASITATGIFKAYLAYGSYPVSPVLKFVVTAPTGESVTIRRARRTQIIGDEAYTFQSTSGGGGGSGGIIQMKYGPNGVYADTDVTNDTTNPLLTRSLPVEVTNLSTLGLTSAMSVSLRRTYVGQTVTTGAWTALGVSLAGTESRFNIFDSSGEILQLGVGTPGNEAHLLYIPPGGAEFAGLDVTAGALSVKAVSANATAGDLVLQAW